MELRATVAVPPRRRREAVRSFRPDVAAPVPDDPAGLAGAPHAANSEATTTMIPSGPRANHEGDLMSGGCDVGSTARWATPTTLRSMQAQGQYDSGGRRRRRPR